MEIRRLKPTAANLRRFVRFPISLYAGNSCYVPPLVIDEMQTLNPAKNPAFDFCDCALFMAYDRDGRPVGRVAGIINRQVNETHRCRTARFGFLDFTDDPAVSSALMAAVEEWARSQGMDRIVGPLGFTDMDREGMLVEGFDELSTMATNYNHPYYPLHMERLGYRKESDWVEFLLTVPDAVPERYARVAAIVAKKYGLRNLKYTSRKKVKADYGHELFHLINQAYSGLYQYSRLSDRQIEYYIDQYLALLDLDLLSIVVDRDDRLVAVGISMPSMSRSLQKSHGRILPWGWVHLLKGLKGKNDRVDLLLVAVHPDYQNKGVNALLFTDLLPYFMAKGFKWAETNPEMETNAKVQGQWDPFNPRQHRRRRSFYKKL